MTELTIQLDSRDEAMLLFGSRDQFLREIRTTLGAQVVGRGDQILVKGTEEQCSLAQRVFDELRRVLRRHGAIGHEDVRTVLEVVLQGGERLEGIGDTKPGEVPSPSFGANRYLRPRTDGQARYVKAMKENDLTICVGPAGTGKCVAADTLVLTGEGLVPIGKLGAGTEPGQYREQATAVSGVNGETLASHVYNGGVSPTVTIRTRHGFQLEGTPEHPVLTLGEDGDLGWLRLDEVKPGTYVAVARGTNLFGTDTAVDFRFEPRPADHSSRPVTLDRLDPDFAYFMGLMVGDGCMRAKSHVIFTSADPELRMAFAQILARWSLHWYPNHDRPYDMVVGSVQLKRLLGHLGLSASLAHQKEVPASILRAPRDLVVAFLQGLFDTDGTVDRRSGYPSFATSSPNLARQVQLLLLNLGVVSRVRSKKTPRRTAYILDITGEEAARFQEAVGFRLARKAALIQIHAPNPNVDVVPHVATLIDNVVREHRFSRATHKEFGDYRTGRRAPSYAKLARLLAHFHLPHEDRDRLESLVRSRFLWSEVTEVGTGHAQVYDLTVPGDHSFVAGGIVNHNTYLAVGMAVSMLRQALIKKIVLVRPAVEAGERLGYLPGDMVAKINPYLRPLLDALNDLMEPEQVKRYMDNDIIEVAPLAFMRGRTLSHAVIILDEGQNTTIAQMKMFLTRMGANSKIIATGDVTQTDLPPHTRSGLVDALQRLKNVEGVALVYLDEHDIVRNPLVARVLKAYEEDKPSRKRSS